MNYSAMIIVITWTDKKKCQLILDKETTHNYSINALVIKVSPISLRKSLL